MLRPTMDPSHKLRALYSLPHGSDKSHGFIGFMTA